MNMPAHYQAIDRWLGAWLEQLRGLGCEGDYRVILSEIEESSNHTEHTDRLTRLDKHLSLASEMCGNFASLVSEKSRLPSDLDEANKTILNKLSEVRAVVGLERLGFADMSFNGSPDLRATRSGSVYSIEITRLGCSEGKRSKVWDIEAGSLQEDGYHVGSMVGGGASVEALSEAIYREIEEKAPQLKGAGGEGVLWVSLGRDYLATGLYELPGVGLLVKMSNPNRALLDAMRYKDESGLYKDVSHVIVSLGRDLDDLVVPALEND
jgi:hypothetical protein